MTAPIKIEKGVPLPPVERVEREGKYPFHTMEVSDSFFQPEAKAAAMHACIARYMNGKGKGSGRKFSLRAVTEDDVAGVRVWRME